MTHQQDDAPADGSLAQLRSESEGLRERLNRFRAALGARFAGKQELADLMVVSALAGQPLLLVGPPGTGKRSLARTFCELLGGGEGDFFDYAVTPGTEHHELVGSGESPARLAKARVGFIGEVFAANSPVLNSLLKLIDEGRLRIGEEPVEVPLLAMFAATQRPPEKAEQGALADRFPLKVLSRPVQGDHFDALTERAADAGAARELGGEPHARLDDLAKAQRLIALELAAAARRSWFPDDVYEEFQHMIQRLARDDFVYVSDRKIVSLCRLLSARAWLFSGGPVARGDLAILAGVGEQLDEIELLHDKVPLLLEQ